MALLPLRGLYGPDGSRTRVRNHFPRPSTSLAYLLTFPPVTGGRRPDTFSSFMIRPYAQSFAYAVSHMDDTPYLKCECLRGAAALRQQMLNRS